MAVTIYTLCTNQRFQYQITKKKSKTKTIRNGKYLLFKTTLREKIYEFTSFPSDFIFLGSIFVSSCSQYALTIPILDNAVFPGDRKLKLPFAETPSSQLGKSDYKTALFWSHKALFSHKSLLTSYLHFIQMFLVWIYLFSPFTDI